MKWLENKLLCRHTIKPFIHSWLGKTNRRKQKLPFELVLHVRTTREGEGGCCAMYSSTTNMTSEHMKAWSPIDNEQTSLKLAHSCEVLVTYVQSRKMWTPVPNNQNVSEKRNAMIWWVLPAKKASLFSGKVSKANFSTLQLCCGTRVYGN